jgi:hypothetical protein
VHQAASRCGSAGHSARMPDEGAGRHTFLQPEELSTELGRPCQFAGHPQGEGAGQFVYCRAGALLPGSSCMYTSSRMGAPVISQS